MGFYWKGWARDLIHLGSVWPQCPFLMRRWGCNHGNMPHLWRHHYFCEWLHPCYLGYSHTDVLPVKSLHFFVAPLFPWRPSSCLLWYITTGHVAMVNVAGTTCKMSCRPLDVHCLDSFHEEAAPYWRGVPYLSTLDNQQVWRLSSKSSLILKNTCKFYPEAMF